MALQRKRIYSVNWRRELQSCLGRLEALEKSVESSWLVSFWIWDKKLKCVKTTQDCVKEKQEKLEQQRQKREQAEQLRINIERGQFLVKKEKEQPLIRRNVSTKTD
eukprot:GHVP01023614.1.p2 GENE.GHVP01023614.1~~GHVP01023614.1.p2  ORF type:complete len:106 (+),score=18.84 GHVP01023614.1:67-384(+)